MRHILLVANQTATSEPLLDAVRDRMAAGPCQFTLLVPSLPSDLANKMSNFGLMEAGVVPPAPVADSTYHSTRQRLDHGLQRLHELGATGEEKSAGRTRWPPSPRSPAATSSTRSSSRRFPVESLAGSARTFRAGSSARHVCR